MTDNKPQTKPTSQTTLAGATSPAGIIYREREYPDGVRVQVWIKKNYGWIIRFAPAERMAV